MPRLSSGTASAGFELRLEEDLERAGMIQTSLLNGLLWLHLGSATLGQITAMVASGASLLYLWQRRLLKTRRLSLIDTRLPSLEPLEKTLAKSLWVGFLALSLTLVSGVFILSGTPQDGAQESAMVTKIVWAILTWSLYFVTLIARHRFYLSWRNLARISLTGFLLLSSLFFAMMLSAMGGHAAS